ncbi:MAG: Smr/MutS family protein, partial [Muribaculaceae bacterium]|nr:Smr/MutS family protein [Muribaculaceae bacterium]
HGTGHGILKTLIREQLRANGAVRHFEDEDVRFGGAGITVVDLE